LIPYEAPVVALSAVLFIGGFAVVRGGGDSYRVLERLLLLVLLLAGFGAIIWPFSFPLLSAQAGGPVILGVTLGSWPDILKLWPTRLGADVREMPKALPDLAAGVAGLVLGVWVWSALASSLGLLGVLLGTIAFAAVVIGVGATPTMVQFLFELRNARKEGSGEE
jgi:hypothetical protein